MLRNQHRHNKKAHKNTDSPNCCSWALLKTAKGKIVNTNPVDSYLPPNPNPSSLNSFGEWFSILFSFIRNRKDWKYVVRLRFLFCSLAFGIVLLFYYEFSCSLENHVMNTDLQFLTTVVWDFLMQWSFFSDGFLHVFHFFLWWKRVFNFVFAFL